ncbi:MAG: NUDIX hydrolase [Acidimicrobiia bacterium]
MSGLWDLPGVLPNLPPSEGEPRAAVLVPLYERNGELHTILTKRPMHMPTHAGDLAFPGGKPDPRDDGPVSTALREASEEVGIEPESVEVIGFLRPIHTVAYERMVVPVVGRLPRRPALQIDATEVEAVLEAPLGPFFSDDNWRFETWQGHRIFFFDLDDEVLWGATAAMVRRLVGLDDDHP